MIGYYIACELFELSDQEQLIYIFGCSKPLLESKDWMTKNIFYEKDSKNIFQRYKLISISITKYIDVNLGLRCACIGGHLHLVNFMIEKGATDWNGGLLYACCYSNLHLVKLMIEKGATDWNEGLFVACCYGNLNIVKLMIEKGANQCGYCGDNSENHPR